MEVPTLFLKMNIKKTINQKSNKVLPTTFLLNSWNDLILCSNMNYSYSPLLLTQGSVDDLPAYSNI